MELCGCRGQESVGLSGKGFGSVEGPGGLRRMLQKGGSWLTKSEESLALGTLDHFPLR